MKNKPQQNEESGGFVIVRMPGRGSINKKPRFGPGWGGLAKATTYPTREEAERVAHGYPGEKIISIEEARAL